MKTNLKFILTVIAVSALAMATSAFVIDHPLDPKNKVLRHQAVESPELKTIYDGIATMDANGQAMVRLPGYFEALNTSFRYQLTPLGGAAPDLHVQTEVLGNRFTIAGGKPGIRVCWQVTGVRNDLHSRLHPVTDEEDKGDNEFTRGQYLNPVDYDVKSSPTGEDMRRKSEIESGRSRKGK